MKIINILSHTPGKEIYKYRNPSEYIQRFPECEYIEIDKKPNWVGFFKLDWHHQWGKYVKNISPQYEVECWRPYGNKIDQVYEKNVDGLKHKIFPSTEIRIKKYGTIEHSTLMLEELQEEIKKNKIIIHIYGSHTSFIIWLLNRLKPITVPVVLQHLGGGFFYFVAKYNKNPLKLLNYFYEKKSLKYVDYYLTASKIEEQFIIKNFPSLNFEFFLNGIDFEKFKLIDKKNAREILGISLEKKVLLYIGRYSIVKSVDKIIEAYKKLKEKDNNIELYLVGGYESDEFYKIALTAGAKIVLRSDSPINNYLASADVYLLPVQDPIVRDFGGFGIAPIEALALNTPVISPNIIHLPSESDVSKLGIVLNSNNLLESIEQVLIKGNYETREVVEKHFDIIKNTQHLIKIYENVSRKYYV
jgi:glycosyltransferase involved in cell wall biosynthesis